MKPTDTFLIITIDTECDKLSDWYTASPLAFRGVTEAIPQRLQPLFASFGIRPTYLLSPEVITNIECRSVLREISNAELGSHLHGEHIVPLIKTWDFAGRRTDDMQWEYPPELEHAKLATLTELFIQQFGYAPKSFRAGRFGISHYTGRCLQELGYWVDSSVTPHVTWTSQAGHKRPDFRGFSEIPYRIDRNGDIWNPGESNFLEVPVTILPYGTVPSVNANEPIWFRPWYSDSDTLCNIMRYVVSQPPENGHRRPLVMMFHNVELIAGASPYPQTDADVTRFLDMLKRVFELSNKMGIKSRTLSEYYQQYCESDRTVKNISVTSNLHSVQINREAKPLRIAFLTPEFVTEQTHAGGLAVFTDRITRTLKDMGCEPEVFTLTEKEPGIIYHDSVRVERITRSDLHPLWIRTLSKLCHKFCIDGTLHDLGCALSLASALTKREHEKPFDFVHCSDYKMTSLFVKQLKERPVLTRCSWARDLFSAVDGEKLTLDNRLINFFERESVRKSDLAYAPSHFVADYMLEKHKIKLSVLRPPFFLEQQPEEQIPYELPARYMIHFGLLGKRKGTDLIAKALPMVWEKEPDFMMVWAGQELNPSIVEESRQLWGNRADQVKWLGSVERPVLYAILKKAEASVLPSRCDNLPNTVIESLLFGVPVIGTDGASIDELVKQGVTGEFVPFEDSGALARAMIRGWREKRMFKGRQYVLREMNPQVAAGNLLKLAGSVVMKSGNSHSLRRFFLNRLIAYLSKQETNDSKLWMIKTLPENRNSILLSLFPTFFRLYRRLILFFEKKAQNSVEQKVESKTISVYEGYLDKADYDEISGWVWNMSRPDTSVYVDIYDNGTFLCVLKSDKYRRDLAIAGKGTGKHAFNCFAPSLLKDGKPHSIQVKVAGTNFELTSSPKEIICTLK